MYLIILIRDAQRNYSNNDVNYEKRPVRPEIVRLENSCKIFYKIKFNLEKIENSF